MAVGSQIDRLPVQEPSCPRVSKKWDLRTMVTSSSGMPYGAPAPINPCDRPSLYGNFDVMMAAREGEHTDYTIVLMML